MRLVGVHTLRSRARASWPRASQAARKFSRCTASTFTGRFQFIADHLDPYAVEQRQRDEAQKQSLFALVAFIEVRDIPKARGRLLSSASLLP